MGQMTPQRNLKHDIADCLNPIAVSLGYLEKLIAAGRNEEALTLLKDVLQPAMERARNTLNQQRPAEEPANTTHEA
jgi:hypothetical protein